MLPRRFALGVLLIIAASGCAQSTTARRETTPERAGSADALTAEERARLEAARRHPIARPEPRPAYPEQAPPPRPERPVYPEEAPPPREMRTPTQAPRELGENERAPAPQPADVESSETRVIAPQPPPAPYPEQAPAAPAPSYVWAPGYWYWYDSHYVWVPGAWLPPRPGYVYVSARWVHTGGGWVFAPGGWALSGGGVVVLPVYRHRYLYHYGPYSYRPHRYWYGPRRNPHYDYQPRNRTWVRPRSHGGWTAPERPRRSEVRPQHHDGGGVRLRSPRPRDYSRPYVRPHSRSSVAPERGERAREPSRRR